MNESTKVIGVREVAADGKDGVRKHQSIEVSSYDRTSRLVSHLTYGNGLTYKMLVPALAGSLE